MNFIIIIIFKKSVFECKQVRIWKIIIRAVHIGLTFLWISLIVPQVPSPDLSVGETLYDLWKARPVKKVSPPSADP